MKQRIQALIGEERIWNKLASLLVTSYSCVPVNRGGALIGGGVDLSQISYKGGGVILVGGGGRFLKIDTQKVPKKG